MVALDQRLQGHETATESATGGRVGKRRGRDPFEMFAVVAVGVFSLVCLAPFWLVVASSITPEAELVTNGYRFWPASVSFESYRTILTGSTVGRAYVASLFITVIGTVMAVLITAGLAYAISTRTPRVSRALGIMTYIPMLFSGGLVPFYILVTQVLQLQNSWWSVILPLLVTPFFVFIMVTFFQSLPQDVLDSARIDGASEMRILFQIVMPMAKPILATIALFYALNYWNEWFTALLFISDQTKFPLQLMLQNLIANVDAAQAIQISSTAAVPIFQMRSALVVITIGPVILAYPFIQRYFINGLTLGATKG